MTRNRLADRRPCEHVDFEHNGTLATVTIGFRWPTWEPQEIFIRCGKAGTAVEAEARDAGVLCSLLLQHGATVDEVLHSLTKTEDGRPASILGAALQAVRQP